MMSQSEIDSNVYDVVIVGGGISGLVAAKELLQTSDSLKVLLIEAKNRVGGRTQTLSLRTSVTNTNELDQWDIGGQWVGNTQLHILKLLEELQIGTYDQYCEGKKFFQCGNVKLRKIGDFLTQTLSTLRAFNVLEAIDFGRMLYTIDRMSHKVDITDPFKNIGSTDYDAMTLDQFMRKSAWTRMQTDAVDLATETVFGCRSRQVSLLYILAYGSAAGTFSDLLSIEGNGAQRYRIKNGSQTVSQKLVELITTKLNNKAEIKLSMAVIAAETMGDTVTLSLMQTGGPTKFQVDQVRCKRVIFAIPPNQLSPINFQPPLPYYRQKLAQGAPIGNLVKFVITYETPFWREMGLSGEIAASGLTHKRGEVRPILTTFDGTTEKGSPALVGFLHNEWAGVESTIRKEAVLEDLARYFGASALTYIDYIDKSWSDEPYSGGCPVAVLPPGMMQYFVHIRNIDGLYHYAATETATSWPGYMDGAVQSGKRVAKEVLLKLNVDNLLPSDMEMGCTLHSDYCPPIEQNRYYPRNKYYYWKSIISVVVLGALIGIVACKVRDNLV